MGYNLEMRQDSLNLLGSDVCLTRMVLTMEINSRVERPTCLTCCNEVTDRAHKQKIVCLIFASV
jgi:hypothetical protein